MAPDKRPVTDPLFVALQLGAIRLPNRIVMAPMTRLRASEPGDLATPMMAEYYGQRATAGLIISEATDISPQARGYEGSPGIYTAQQIAAWRQVTDRIHVEGGRCCVQLWHTGRNSHVSLQPGQGAPVAPSAIPSHSRTSLRDAQGQVVRVETSTPRALARHEIAAIVDDFAQAVANAREAGFDLVEIHGAHGYLLHQFLSPLSNHRQDDYGGSIENRARLMLDVVDAAIGAWSGDRVGIRLFPSGPFKGLLSSMGPGQHDPHTQQDALYVIAELARRRLAYLHLSEPDWTGGEPLSDDFRQRIRDVYPGVIIGAGSYSPEKGRQMINAGYIDGVAFGRDFIANPDFVSRVAHHGPFNRADPATFYGGGAEGYVDYPRLG